MFYKKLLKTGCFALAAAMITISATGCGSEKKAEDTTKATEAVSTESVSSTDTEANADSDIKDETYQVAPPVAGDTVVTISFKDYGDVKIKMFPNEAPKAVENFTTLATQGYYNGLTLHRIIKNFMIQGGDPTGTGAGGESIWGEAFEDEFVDYLVPIRGSLCMANAGLDTNGSQFFITQIAETGTTDYPGLSEVATKLYQNNGGAPWLTNHHTVFGQVYSGMDIVDKIAAVETDANDAPTESVIIENVSVDTFK